MSSIQIRDVPDQVKHTLAEVARSRGQSMQVYLRNLLEEDARRANNIALLDRVRAVGGGHAAAIGETARELDVLRAERDHRPTAAA